MHRNCFVFVAFFSLFFVEALDAQLVSFRLEATDMVGNALSTVNVGEDFILNSYARDLRTEDQCTLGCGVFAGYMDITYDAQLAEVGGATVYGDHFQNGATGDLTTPGLMNDIGGFSTSLEPIGLDEYHLFSVPMKAMSMGSLSLESASANNPPQHHVLLFGIDGPINDIDFGAASVQIVPEPSGGMLLMFGMMFIAWRRKT